MSERIASDHPSVETLRGTVERAGGPRQLGVAVPAEAAGSVPADEVVRVVLAEAERYARFTRRGDRFVLPGVYDTPAAARGTGEGRDRLRPWLREAGLERGRSVLLDVVVPGFRYGLRRPGTSTVYDASRPPRQGLQDIAADLEDD